MLYSFVSKTCLKSINSWWILSWGWSFSFILECEKKSTEEIIKLLNFYKLRSKVNFSDVSKNYVAAAISLEMFKEIKNIDLILMDIKMPVMDGHEAYVEIRKINSKVPIIAQTAYSLSQDISKINETGFNAYINKPLNKQTLLDLINKTILQSN